MVNVKSVTNFGGANVNVTAQLWPAAKRDSDNDKNSTDLKSTLSFEHDAEDPEFADDARDGAWLIVSDCITYLLYPFVTCGDTQEWSTGLSVSNTSKDDGVFGAFDETEEQSGSVILYGFPAGGEASVSEMLTSNLAAGDTITRACDKNPYGRDARLLDHQSQFPTRPRRGLCHGQLLTAEPRLTLPTGTWPKS